MLLSQDPFFSAKYRDALERENRVRECAMLRFPHLVCGIEIRALTLEDDALFRAIGNPFFVGGFRYKADAAQLLWYLSPKFRTPDTFLGRCARTRFLARLARIDGDALIIGVSDYLDEIFMDAPRASRDGDEPTVGFAAAVVDTLMSDGLWKRAEIMALPLPEVWQYVRRRSRTPVGNRLSDAVLREFGRAQREKAGAAA